MTRDEFEEWLDETNAEVTEGLGESDKPLALWLADLYTNMRKVARLEEEVDDEIDDEESDNDEAL